MRPTLVRLRRGSRVSRIVSSNGLSKNSAVPTFTAGELFSDGSAIEVIRDSESGHATLLDFDSKRARIGRRIRSHGRVFEPLKVPDSILDALILPTGFRPYGSTRKLFTEISALVSRVTPRLPVEMVELLAFFVMATWLIDRLPVAPFIWITVPAIVSCAALSQLLSLFCRHALLVAHLTTAGLRSLPMQLRPTILANVSKETPDLLRLLRASSRPNSYVPDRGGVVDLFCAKIVFANHPLRDPASAGFPLEIVLPPTEECAPPMDLVECERVAAEFQSKLLSYRVENDVKVITPQLDLRGFTPTTQEIIRTLAACIIDDDELRSRVVFLLKPHDTEIHVGLTSELEAIVLEALLAQCHTPRHKPLPMMELAKMVNTILAGRGDSLEVSPETIGWKLRALGLHSNFIAGGRKGLRLTMKTRARIHILASAYGVRTLRIGVIKGICPFCDRLSGPKAQSNVAEKAS